MPTRYVVHTDHQSALVERLVTSGRYQNANEVLRKGLRLVEQREAENACSLKTLRSAVQTGIADIKSARSKILDSSESLRLYIYDQAGK